MPEYLSSVLRNNGFLVWRVTKRECYPKISLERLDGVLEKREDRCRSCFGKRYVLNTETKDNLFSRSKQMRGQVMNRNILDRGVLL